jgi:hypothetical protein
MDEDEIFLSSAEMRLIMKLLHADEDIPEAAELHDKLADHFSRHIDQEGGRNGARITVVKE